MLDVLGAVLLLIAELFIMTVTGLLFQAGRSGEDLSLCDAACDGFFQDVYGRRQEFLIFGVCCEQELFQIVL